MYKVQPVYATRSTSISSPQQVLKALTVYIDRHRTEIHTGYSDAISLQSCSWCEISQAAIPFAWLHLDVVNYHISSPCYSHGESQGRRLAHHWLLVNPIFLTPIQQIFIEDQQNIVGWFVTAYWWAGWKFSRGKWWLFAVLNRGHQSWPSHYGLLICFDTWGHIS